MAIESDAGEKQMLETARTLGREAKLDREAAQRMLLLGAMAEAVAGKGYEECRVDDVLKLSSLSRSTFYRHFEGKEECFFAAFEWAAERIFAAAEEAISDGEEEPAAKVEAALRAVVGRLASEPGIARLVLIEVRAANAACREAQLRWLGRFAELFEAATEGLGDPAMARLTVGAVSALLSAEVGEKGSESLPEALPQLIYVALAPYIGPSAASERAR